MHARSALNLRLALSLFGIVVSGVAAVLFFVLGSTAGGIFFAVLAAIALVDAIVVQRRRAERRRIETRGETRPDHGLFE
jgi:flavin-dependent dehydrogenase